jgi:hypothetical protein
LKIELGDTCLANAAAWQAEPSVRNRWPSALF